VERLYPVFMATDVCDRSLTMKPVSQDVLQSWSVPPATSFALALAAVIYLRGWILLQLAHVPSVPLWRAISFLSGLLSIWIALASPLDTFSGFVLTAHMLQHIVLMMVAPPLILLGNPLVPSVRGLSKFAAREFVGPFLNWRLATRVGNTLTQPVVALLLMGVVMFAWHVPKMYELALHSAAWHEFEHACFFLVALIFWWPVLQPWPSRVKSPRWAMVPYLLLADVQNTALSAILVFSDRVLYPSYAVMPRLFGSALEDQAAAGALTWVAGSLAFVVPAVAIAVECLSIGDSSQRTTTPRTASRTTLTASPLSPPPRHSFIGLLLQSRLQGRAVEATSFLVMFVIAGLCFAALASSDTGDDGDQALRFKGQSGPFTMSVFGQPGDLPTGHANFDILVQDRDTQDVQLDAIVDLSIVSDADSPGSFSVAHAVREKAENKLLQTAELNLPNEGNWRMRVSVKRHAQVADFVLPLHVVRQQTAPEHLYLWRYIAILILGVVLLVVYVRRHNNPVGALAENRVQSLEPRLLRRNAD
jgi:cytochrome c oxidase assembly factor CtaG